MVIQIILRIIWKSQLQIFMLTKPHYLTPFSTTHLNGVPEYTCFVCIIHLMFWNFYFTQTLGLEPCTFCISASKLPNYYTYQIKNAKASENYRRTAFKNYVDFEKFISLNSLQRTFQKTSHKLLSNNLAIQYFQIQPIKMTRSSWCDKWRQILSRK